MKVLPVKAVYRKSDAVISKIHIFSDYTASQNTIFNRARNDVVETSSVFLVNLMLDPERSLFLSQTCPPSRAAQARRAGLTEGPEKDLMVDAPG